MHLNKFYNSNISITGSVFEYYYNKQEDLEAIMDFDSQCESVVVVTPQGDKGNTLFTK